MVTGLAGQSVEAQRGNGTHQAAFGLCVPNGQGYADSADGHRAATGYALYRGYAQETGPPLSQKAVHLDHGRGQSVAIPPLETMARHSARSEEHTSELQSLMRTSYAGFCLKKKKKNKKQI